MMTALNPGFRGEAPLTQGFEMSPFQGEDRMVTAA